MIVQRRDDLGLWVIINRELVDSASNKINSIALNYA
jgi:hypothetical protein